MTHNAKERIIHKKDNPELFEHLEGLMFEGGTETEVDGQRYNIARDEDGEETFVLSPVR